MPLGPGLRAHAGAIAGYDPRDPTASVLPVPDYTAALTGQVKGLRVGLLRAFFLESAAPEVRAAVEVALRALEGMGAVVSEVALDSAPMAAGVSSAVLARRPMPITSRGSGRGGRTTATT